MSRTMCWKEPSAKAPMAEELEGKEDDDEEEEEDSRDEEDAPTPASRDLYPRTGWRDFGGAGGGAEEDEEEEEE